mmetsp:Transcript_37554/g.88724  ORF Transcript_37554/g.88724 Transcript_37554/m.88724 type:complete len:232 (+) Transcript_37554:535-1230(+)
MSHIQCVIDSMRTELVESVADVLSIVLEWVRKAITKATTQIELCCARWIGCTEIRISVCAEFRTREYSQEGFSPLSHRLLLLAFSVQTVAMIGSQLGSEPRLPETRSQASSEEQSQRPCCPRSRCDPCARSPAKSSLTLLNRPDHSLNLSHHELEACFANVCGADESTTLRSSGAPWQAWRRALSCSRPRSTLFLWHPDDCEHRDRCAEWEPFRTPVSVFALLFRKQSTFH